jgi:hydroxymethylpyrimidine pyrophosphatase-like HAD family hydrolase
VRPQFYHDIYGETIGIIEAFSSEATKAKAVRALADRIGADRIVAFGDNINDLPMMREADLAVAVGNARDEVKEAADIVIGPNTEDSVAKFIAEE